MRHTDSMGGWLLQSLLLLLAGVVLGGCGFHLRGSGLSSSVESVWITAQRNVSVDDALRLRLGYAKVALEQDADLVVNLLAERLDRQSVSVTEQGRAAEYELTLDVQYQISRRSAGLLAAPSWIHSRRHYRFDRFNIIGSSEEQALLEQEMRNDIAQQIIRSLNAVSRAAAAS